MMHRTMRLLANLFLLALLALPAASAWATTAGTAANSQIINTATLSSNGVVIASSTVVVTVALVPAQPTVTIASSSGTYQGPNTPFVTDAVIITTNANGPASYTITPTALVFNNTNGASVSVSGAATFVLGASISTGTSSTTSFTVPSFPFAIDPGNNSASQINGIGVNDDIVFTVGGITYTRKVTAVSNPGTQSATSTAIITFDGSALPSAPGPGTPIYEKQTISLNVLPGTVITSGTPIKVDVQAVVTTPVVASVTVGTSPVGADLSTPNTWITQSPTVDAIKYVRNLTAAGNPSVGGTPFTLNLTYPSGTGVTSTYYRGGVTANKGDVLEYVVVASNTASTAGGNLSNCFLSDLIPTAFATFYISQYGAVGRDIWYINEAGAETFLAAGATGQATYIAANNPNLVVNVGTGAGSGAPGLLPYSKNVKIFYQVTVK